MHRVTCLDPKDRLLIIGKAGYREDSVAKLCRNFGISRKTFYKWLARYQKDGENGLFDSRPRGRNHPRFIPAECEKALLDFVAGNPEHSVHKLHKSFNETILRQGGAWRVGHHGIQNVLERKGLNTYQTRLLFAKQYQTAPAVRISPLYKPEIPVYKWRMLFAPFKTVPKLVLTKPFLGILTSLLTSLPLILIFLFLRSIAGAPPGVSTVGLIFATIALFFGLFFFLYSMKYYISVLMVLKMAQGGTSGPTQMSADSKPISADLTQSAKSAKISLISKTMKLFSKLGIKITIPYREKPYRVNPLLLNLDKVELSPGERPFVSIHAAIFNERRVVERLIQSCTRQDWMVTGASGNQVTGASGPNPDNPNTRIPGNQIAAYEVIIVDDSTDGTTDIAKQTLIDGGWQLVTQNAERLTTNAEENEAAIDNSQSAFGNKIAAVQGYQWHVLNKSANWITRGVRTEYAGSYVIERSGEEIYQGLKQIAGSVYAIRADVLREFGWGTSITEDFELTLRLYEAGYKIAFTPYIQAPAEAVSTIKRLIRQRMRWAEGASFNVKCMLLRLLKSPKLTTAEKLEFLYLAPYYLQAAFFIIGTIAWFMSEVVLGAHLPFWTSAFGWSLVFTNLLALPLMNIVGLFLEESDERDYVGVLSFIALSYIVVPFQAYAAIKGFLESQEGPWFRTPKTGLITDVTGRSTFSKLFGQLLGGRTAGVHANVNANESMRMDANISINSQVSNSPSNSHEPAKPAWSFVPAINFGNFRSGIRQHNRMVGRAILSFVLIITIGINYLTFVGRYEIVWGANKLAVGGLTLPLPSVAPSPSSKFKVQSSKLTEGQGGAEVKLASAASAESDSASASQSDPGVEQQINIIDQEFSTALTTDTPTDDSLGLVCWNNNASSCGITTGQYTGATVYFEAVIKNSNTGTTTASLYAAAGGAQVSGSAVTATGNVYKRVRSGSITLTNNSDYTVRIKASAGTASIIAARIIVIQSTVSTFVDTQTHIEVGNNETTTSTSMNTLTNPKYFQYDDSKYDGTTKAAYFEATLLASTKVPTVESTTTSVTASDATSLVVNMPATRPDNDLYIVQVSKDDDVAMTAAGGWSPIQNMTAGSQARFATWYKLGSSEPATYTWTGDSEEWVGAVHRISGINTTNPINTSGAGQGSSAAPIAPDVTTTVDNALILYMFGADDDDDTTPYEPTGTTAIFQQKSATGVGTTLTAAASKAQTSLGATGTGTFAMALSEEWAGITIAVAPSTSSLSNAIAELYNRTDGATVTESLVTYSTSASTYGRVRSPALSTNWDTAAADEYEVRYKTAGGTAKMANAKVILTQNAGAGLSKLELYHNYINTGQTKNPSDIGTFDTTSQGQLPAVRSFHTTIASTVGSSTYVYVLGGFDGGATRSTVYKATLNSTTGDVSTFDTTSQGQLPAIRESHTTIASTVGSSTYVYVLGGYDSAALAYRSTVYKATLNSTSGDVSTFDTTSQGQLPAIRGRHTTIASTVGFSTYIYVLGGSDGGYQSTVYKSTLNKGFERVRSSSISPTSASGGDIATAFATTNQGQLPATLYSPITVTSTVGSSTYAYVLGGCSVGFCTTYASTVYKATLNGTTGDVSAFSTTSQAQLPQTLSEQMTVTSTIGFSTYVYMLGGFDSSANVSTVYKATLNGTTGDVSTFATTSQFQLPAIIRLHTAALATTTGNSTFLYVLGGITGSTVSTVYKSELVPGTEYDTQIQNATVANSTLIIQISNLSIPERLLALLPLGLLLPRLIQIAKKRRAKKKLLDC